MRHLTDGQTVAAILTTLNDEPAGGPASSFYIALGMDLDLWQRISGGLQRNGMLSIEHDWVKPTIQGRALAVEIEQALAAVRAQRGKGKA